MIEKTYYIENSAKLDGALHAIAFIVPCHVKRIYIEMDYSEVTIVARPEYLNIIEKELAPLV